ncbi:MAG: glutathione S-transferase [Pseudomonadota bacterium]
MIEIWGRRDSFNVQKVLWLAAEIGLEHRSIPAGGEAGRLDDPEFTALTPHHKVPVLRDGEVAVWESHAILRYLAARYGGPDWWSVAAAERARVDGWLDWTATRLQPDFLSGVFWGGYRTPEAERDRPRLKQAIVATGRNMALLDRMLAGRKWMLGSRPCLADIAIGTHLYRYFEMPLERPDLPHLRRRYDHLCTRDSYRTTVCVPFDHMEGRLAY